MNTEYEVRYSNNPNDAKQYGTERLREEFLVQNLMEEDKVSLVYSHNDRFIVGSAVPVNNSLVLETIDPLKAEYFLQRREIGLINIGGQGVVIVDNEEYVVGHREALYIGSGRKSIIFTSTDSTKPAKYYINSAPAHTEYPIVLVTAEKANVLELGSLETSNHRFIRQLIINGVVETCQLQMGMTELQLGSVWNTMPAHQHDRRMEAYFYFDIKPEQAVCHFMGEPKETRLIWTHNEQALISPSWSIHSGAGSSNYSFIWGMAGENLDYDDMDKYTAAELR